MAICETCGASFNRTHNLNRHNRDVHKVVSIKEKRFFCDICNAGYKKKETIKRHLLDVHETFENLAVKISKSGVVREPKIRIRPRQTKCPLCEVSVTTYKYLERHLSDLHGVSTEHEDHTFSSIADFDVWRRSEEDANKFRFVKKTKSSKLFYYYCHCSGSIRRCSQGLRVRWKPSIKINKNCPVRLIAQIHGNSVHVKYCKTHLGHQPSVKDVPLRKEERAAVAAKLAAGVNHARIIDDIRDEVDGSVFERIHLLDKRDIYNITKEFQLDTETLSSDDYLSTQLLVSKQMSLGEFSPIIYFKHQGALDTTGRLKEEDFLIVIMTKYQEEVVSEYATDKVLIDSTHGMAGHDFQLTSVVTVDEYGAGCPVAMCLSNRIDAIAMEVFFQCVKSRVGVISPTVFMTDDAPAFFNAWCSTMGEPMHQLLCSWHIDRSWKGKLQTIKNKHKRAEVYKSCRTLLETEEASNFYLLLPNFLQLLNEDPDCKSFGEYFDHNYAHRAEKWAYCFRRNLGLNTNMYLEALHKNLKYCYLDGKKNRRVDRCISLVLKYSRNMMFERLVRAAKNKPSHRMAKISSAHRRSALIGPDAVSKTHDCTWMVQSTSRMGVSHTVVVWETTSCNVLFCPLSCPECQICVHQASCSCEDYAIKGNLCKHIHAVSPSTRALRIETPVPLPLEEHLAAIGQIPLVDGTDVPFDIDVKITDLTNALPRYLAKIPDRSDKLELFEKMTAVIERARKLANKATAKIRAPVASHSNITPQQRFGSTKKKRRGTSKNVLSKPTGPEKSEFFSRIVNGGETLFVHRSPDHQY